MAVGKPGIVTERTWQAAVGGRFHPGPGRRRWDAAVCICAGARSRSLSLCRCDPAQAAPVVRVVIDDRTAVGRLYIRSKHWATCLAMAPSEFRAQGSRAAPGEWSRPAMTWEVMVGSRKFVAAGARNSRGDGEDTAKNEDPRSGALMPRRAVPAYRMAKFSPSSDGYEHPLWAQAEAGQGKREKSLKTAEMRDSAAAIAQLEASLYARRTAFIRV